MSPYVMALLLFTLGLGTTVTFASSHWLLAWMGLEINTLAILPIMTQTHHPRAIEAATKYFLVQATAAATLLFASMSNAWLTGQWNISLTIHPLPTALLILALSLKIGLAPLHTWVPEVLQGLDLTTGLILSTWQKLAPFALLLQLPLHNQPLTVGLGLTSILIGGWGGLNQTQLRKIIAYSSIAHLGWMMIVIQFAPTLTLLALSLYLVMTSTAFLTLKLANATTINALATSQTKSPVVSATFLMALLSLGGLPPLTGFLPKWLILQQITKEDLPAIATIAALAALLSLYFYLRISYAMTLTLSPSTVSATVSWRLPNSCNSMILPLLTAASLLLLPAAPALVPLLAL